MEYKFTYCERIEDYPNFAERFESNLFDGDNLNIFEFPELKGKKVKAINEQGVYNEYFDDTSAWNSYLESRLEEFLNEVDIDPEYEPDEDEEDQFSGEIFKSNEEAIKYFHENEDEFSNEYYEEMPFLCIDTILDDSGNFLYCAVKYLAECVQSCRGYELYEPLGIEERDQMAKYLYEHLLKEESED